MKFLFILLLSSSVYSQTKPFQEIDPQIEKKYEREKLLREEAIKQKLEKDRQAKIRKDEEEKRLRDEKERELKAEKIRENARAWQELVKKKEAEDAAKAKAAEDAAKAQAAADAAKAQAAADAAKARAAADAAKVNAGKSKAVDKGETGNSPGYSGEECPSPSFTGVNLGMEPPEPCQIDEEKLMKCSDKNTPKLFEIYSHYSKTNPGVFSVRLHASYNCHTSRKICRDSFCNNPCMPMFCEFDGKVFARQQMRQYKNYTKETISH